MTTPMIDILLGDTVFAMPVMRTHVWGGDDNRFATLDLKALAQEVGNMRTALIEARAHRDAWVLEAHERNDENKLLRTQLAAARVVTDAMVERARESYRSAWWHEEATSDGEAFTKEARQRIWRDALTTTPTEATP